MRDDQVEISHEVVALLTDHDCNLLGAWRRYRKMSLTEFGKLMGMNEAELVQLDKTDNSNSTALEKAAEILNCDADQLSD